MVPGKMELRATLGYGYVSVAVRHFKGLFATKRMTFSSIFICLITCMRAVLSPLAFLWYWETFVVLVWIVLSLYYIW